MSEQDEIAALEARVKDLIEHVDKMRADIERHEFGQAALEAHAVGACCHILNTIANRIADRS